MTTCLTFICQTLNTAHSAKFDLLHLEQPLLQRVAGRNQFGDETHNPPSSDNKIVNNLLGNAKNIYYWPGSSGGGLVSVVIAYNTCVDSSVGLI
jgi:hypothetical protein